MHSRNVCILIGTKVEKRSYHRTVDTRQEQDYIREHFAGLVQHRVVPLLVPVGDPEDVQEICMYPLPEPD